MNNLFKNNSRFASLADEDGFVKVDNKSKKVKEENKKEENKKKEENTSNRFKFDDSEKEVNAFKKDNNYRDDRYRNDKNRDDRYRRNDFVSKKPEPMRKPEPEPVILTTDDFSTSLSTIKTEEQKKPIISFAERAALNANKGEVVKAASKVTSVWEEKVYSDNRSEQQMAYDVLDALCDLHERRTAMYIERYGYDAWERTFKFEGWEEEEAYNQKLDDEYERWLEKEEEMELAKYEEMEREEERLANNDRYNNYWKYY